MGIDINALKFLATVRRDGGDFTRTVMIGRQRLYVSVSDVRRILPVAAGGAAAPPEGPAAYAEWVLRGLGAERTDALDVSDYEGATILQDMNQPLGEEHRGRYSMVIECGTLEHVFNFPVAIQNCMDLAEVGGQILCCTVANNFCGHGFYQFSPELFYRVFHPTNGFQIERMIVCDAFYESEWYTVCDPEVARGRVEIVGPYPVMLLVQARKTAAVPLFRTPPQQSDYAAAWSGEIEHADHKPTMPRRGRFSLRTLIPGWAARWVRSLRSARQFRASHFRKATAFALWEGGPSR
jgi:hypothetical protein